MVEIDAKVVMQLRNKTGLSMMECKKALQESAGDLVQAEEVLFKKLKGKMDTRTDRAAGEGRLAVALAPDGRSVAIAELRAETDFTAKNEKFQSAVSRIAELALAAGPGPVSPTPEMQRLVDDLRVSTGENISLARAHRLAGGPNSSFGTYVHHDGKTAVVLECEGPMPRDLAKDICMHIAAAQPRPQGVDRNSIPAAVIERERRLAIEMAMESGKPKEIAEKMVEGKINKLYSELALLEQEFVKDPSRKIRDLLPAGATIRSFLRWQVGVEG